MKPLYKWPPRVAFFLFALCLFLQAQSQTVLVPPPDANEFLRHDKHGMLVIGNPDQDKGWLVTRHATSEKKLNLTPQNWAIFALLSHYIAGDSALNGRDVFQWLFFAHRKLIAPFQPALEELNEITVVPCRELRRLPFEAFIPFLPFETRPDFHFLGETHTISYLMNFDFQKQHPKDQRIQLVYDSTGSFWSAPFPNSQVHLVSRSPDQQFFPPGVLKHFQQLIENGIATHEALGIARNQHLATLRKGKGNPPSNQLDPRHWAQALVYGETNPVNPVQGFPWWILVPIGLLLVIVFGKRL